MNRRQLISGIGAAGALACASPALGQAGGALTLSMLSAAWALWKSRHLDPSGRVVDELQNGASHSEGQGYGLTLAAAMGDEQAASAIVRWTEDTLAIRDDGLLAWRWLPNRAQSIPDTNNASDGDLFFAWGCLRAGRRFDRPSLIERARDIASSLSERCLVPDPRGNGRLLFIPAVEGFERDGSVIVNPSYAMPQALAELGSVTGEPELVQAARDSLTLLSDLAAEGTTPDWIAVTSRGLAVDSILSDRTGYEAVRMPLFLIWSGFEQHPMVERHRTTLAATGPRPSQAPVVLERTTGEVVEWSGESGYHALMTMLGCGMRSNSNPFFPVPPFGANQPYYPSTLHLMALAAQITRYPTCVPL